MGFSDWVKKSASKTRKNGLRSGVRESAYEFWIGALGRFHWLKSGTHIYERDWDALIVLDACRADLMAEVVDQYDFLEDTEAVVSPASTSLEWMKKNFSSAYGAEMEQTAYVTSNLYSEEMINPNDFAELDEVWRYGWDEDLRTIPPRRVTDQAIRQGRRTQSERLIVHYMQPHYPFILFPDLAPGMRAPEDEKSIWKQLRDNDVTESEVWEAYLANLQHVLDDLTLLLRNLDAETVVITADHGNAFGKMGVYGHPYGVPLASLRRVPWITTTAKDTREYEPKPRSDRSSTSIDEKLSALGYKE